MKLSPTEAHILSTLEQANGEVVKRQEFGIESEPNINTNVLEVMVCRLRKKMHEAEFHGKQIQTVRGIGYRLVTVKPSWDDAPEWANWLAVDDDGEATWFEDEPTKFVGLSKFWVNPDGGRRTENAVSGWLNYGEIEPHLEPRP